MYLNSVDILPDKVLAEKMIEPIIGREKMLLQRR